MYMHKNKKTAYLKFNYIHIRKFIPPRRTVGIVSIESNSGVVNNSISPQPCEIILKSDKHGSYTKVPKFVAKGSIL